MKKIYYYNEITDDVIKNKNQDYKLKNNYIWIHNNIFYKILSYLVYYLFLIVSFIYIKLIKKVKIKNKKIIKDNNYFIYGNHTNPLVDVFVIPLITFPKRPYIIVSPANLGIPIIGKLLPLAGALPIPDDIHKMIEFINAVEKRSKTNPIIIYPEAHVWPYYTKIREFPATSFKFPLLNNSTVYTSTTTYSKRKYSNNPKITIYIDGPFISNKENKKEKEKEKELHDLVYNSLLNNSKHSNYEYVSYKKIQD